MVPCRQSFSVFHKLLSKNVCPTVDEDRYGDRDPDGVRHRNTDRDGDELVYA